MAKLSQIIVDVDASTLLPMLQQLNTDLDRLSADARQRLLNVIDDPAELVRVEGDFATGAGCTVRFEPAELLLNLLAALRTGNLDDCVVKHAHGGTSK